MNTAPAPSPDPVSEDIAAFLRQHGVTGEVQLFPLPGGANNRVYRVPRPGGDWVLKCYFQNPHDPRDRFGAERAFYEWLLARGIRRTPEPLAWCPARRLGLFTWVPGRKLHPEEVNAARVQEALDFVGELNLSRDLPAAQVMSIASEACFSLSEHLACVDRRLARLQPIPAPDPVDQQAANFIDKELGPTWQRLRAAICESAAKSGARLDTPLAPAARCLSPSDFGFHNAMLAPDGWLRFFDFEYAGWDDPAKLVCDFFCQPELPAGHDQWPTFLDQLGVRLNADAGLPVRARLLWPAYQIKWCGIMLNEFVRREQTRRTFAAGASLSADRKAAQLAKARKGLAKAVELWPGAA